MDNRKFVVVEQAGYDGEYEARDFPTYREASDWMTKKYTKDELDSMHPDCLNVDIRQDWTDEEGEHSEYVC